LTDGQVTPRSFDEAHLWNPALRALMHKIEVVENQEYTRAYARLPVEHHTRVTVAMANGEMLVGEAGGGKNELSALKTDREIEDKFRMLCEESLGAHRVDALLAQLWRLEQMQDVAAIPPGFAID
jgi:2-methylcitrate dehydratase